MRRSVLFTFYEKRREIVFYFVFDHLYLRGVKCVSSCRRLVMPCLCLCKVV